ncbi:hypothetical protein HDU81_006661 [Chytriomyces hyalinus]|nr:hypothetical protein HDU81_006661 [Chytriomyces hyalinus]
MTDEDDIELILREIDTSINGKSQKKPTTTSNAFNKAPARDTSSTQTLYNSNTSEQHKQTHPISRSEVKSSSRRKAKDSLAASVDSLLDGLDLLDLDCRHNKLKTENNDLSDILQLRVESESKKACETAVQVPQRHKHKCFSVRLSNGTDAKACSSIRCVACDFPVIAFTKLSTSTGTGVEWSNDADYLFFRNYYPDPQRLQTKLHPTS